MPFGSTDGAVVRALTSHLCDPVSIPEPGVTCRLSLLLVLVHAPRVFCPGFPVFLPPQKPIRSANEGHRFVSFAVSVALTKLGYSFGPHLPIWSISGSNPSPGLVVFLTISDNHGGCHGNTVT